LTAIKRARLRGEGFRFFDYDLDSSDTVSADTMTDALVDWCRVTIAQSRRPFGIDNFDLVVGGCRDGDQPRKSSFRGLRPMYLYGAEGVAVIRKAVSESIATSATSGCHLSAALFPWGDVASRALQNS